MKKYILAHPYVLLLATVTLGLLQGLIAYTSLVIGNIIDAISTGNRDRFFSYIIVAAIVVPLIWLLGCLGIRMGLAYGMKSKRTLQKDFFDSVLATKISDFNQINSAKYISMLNNDINTVAERYFSAVPQFTKDSLTVAFAIIAMAIINPVNALIATATAALPLVAPMLYSNRLAKTQLEVSARKITFNQKIKDYLSGFEVIKTYGVENNIRPRFYNSANNLMKATYKAGAVVSDVGALTVAIMMGVTFMNYFVAGYFVLRGDITVGGVVAIVGLSTHILQPMTLVSNHISGMKSTKEISKRILDVMSLKDCTIRDIKISTPVNSIEFKNVSFAYDTEEKWSETEKPHAITGFSYSFKKGGKYAIVGASGSGKSTIAKLIMGYYDNYEGYVRVNGHSIHNIARENLYNAVSNLHQNVFILDDDLRNNITLYNNYSDDEYHMALTKANLLDVESRFTNASNKGLGEGGNTLSGGERQRISIARAIIKGSEVMVLDEATASLDNIVAHDIENTILEMKGLTCIFITHRYSKETLQKCDGILVMKNGELHEHGSYEELYKKKGHFYNLLNSAS